MNEIILKDETKAHLLSYVLIFSFVAIGILCDAILDHGFTVGVSISNLCLSLIVALTIVYYKNHQAFVRIDATCISYQETKGLSKNIRTKWNFKFNENAQIILTESQTPVGDASNRADSIKITIVLKSYRYVEKRIVARLDSNLKNRIRSFAAKNNLNLIIG